MLYDRIKIRNIFLLSLEEVLYLNEQITLRELLEQISKQIPAEEKEKTVQMFEKKAEYDRYEVISAFHKELRRGDTEKAYYWGTVLADGGSKKYPLQYMFKVATEETHSPELKAFLADFLANHRKVTNEEFCRAVHGFCSYPHKKFAVEISDVVWRKDSYYWLHTTKDSEKKIRRFEPEKSRVDFWTSNKNLLGESKLDREARPPYKAYEVWALIEQFIEEKDLNRLLYMNSFLDNEVKNIKALRYLARDDDRALMLIDKLDQPNVKSQMWFFDTETIFLLLMGYGDQIPEIEIDTGDDETIEGIVNRVSKLYLSGEEVEIPLYARDPHTRVGKQLWFKYRKFLRSGEPCEHLDMRYSGYWIGVAWRYYAYKQHGSVLVPWEAVEIPKDVMQSTVWEGFYPEIFWTESTLDRGEKDG